MNKTYWRWYKCIRDEVTSDKAIEIEVEIEIEIKNWDM